jgi:hypothetical protein
VEGVSVDQVDNRNEKIGTRKENSSVGLRGDKSRTNEMISDL